MREIQQVEDFRIKSKYVSSYSVLKFQRAPKFIPP